MVKSMRDLLSALILAVCLIGSAWAACPDGDISGDCQVDFDDVNFLAERWLDPAGSPARTTAALSPTPELS
ncbi:MAG: hypothetical protein KAY65_05915 [Planctomycetes bacterium]|nr:hypothetical protein [Planctomycetota bacterium]